MHFELNQEQQQLADAVRRWIGRDYGFEARRASVQSGAGGPAAAWTTMAELGLMALPVPEEHGGFGGDAVAMFAVMQELGRGLVVEPYMATVLGAEFLRLGGAHGALLERVAAGELKLACALGERHSRHDAFDISTRAEAVDGGYRLHGEKCVVVHGAEADVLVVSARAAGDGHAAGGVSLFAVPRDSAGLGVTDYRTLDGLRAANVVFDGVAVGAQALIGRAGEGGAILDAALDYGTGLLCAEALGAMQALFDATLEYLKTRKQFGVPIGSFQVLQHRMADMAIHLEQACSMAWLAALTLARCRGAGRDASAAMPAEAKAEAKAGVEANPEVEANAGAGTETGAGVGPAARIDAKADTDAGTAADTAPDTAADADPGARAGADTDAALRRRVVSAAKYRVGLAARFIGQGAVQLHGGMGVTDELPASHYFKRLSLIELTLGDMDHHLERFIAQPGFREVA